MLDERLYTVFSLYPTCERAADIGTDHGYLPCALLQANKCDTMLLTDISSKALSNAAAETARRGLSSRVTLLCGDGLKPLDRTCDVISITGMGGRTLSTILKEGSEKLQGATLILSAHTDLPLLRRTLEDMNYVLEHEELCKVAGRFYLVFKAVPGSPHSSDRELRLGSLLFRSRSPHLKEYLDHRIRVLEKKLQGWITADDPALKDSVSEIREDLAFLRQTLSDLT